MFHSASDSNHALYTSPSAGGLHPLDLYVVLEGVDGLPDGTHHFDPVEGCLRHLADERRQAFAAAALQDDERRDVRSARPRRRQRSSALSRRAGARGTCTLSAAAV